MAESITKNEGAEDFIAQTLAVYDRTASQYVERTQALDLRPEHARFLKHVKAGATLLDLGCGSGRDALAFHRAGYAVTAVDGSEQMVALAREHTGLPVQQQLHGDLDEVAGYDGVWACASLLHLPARPLNEVLRRVLRALKAGGVFYCSFKLGHGARLDDIGRYFRDFTATQLGEYLAYLGFRVEELWFSEHKSAPGTRWVNALAFKPKVALDLGA